MPEKKRVCIIGAGPSGMSAMYHFDKLKKQGKEIPEITCYEKQSSPGGLWNFTWRTGMTYGIKENYSIKSCLLFLNPPVIVNKGPSLKTSNSISPPVVISML